MTKTGLRVPDALADLARNARGGGGGKGKGKGRYRPY